MSEYPVPVHPSGREKTPPEASLGLQGTFVEIISRGVGEEVSVAHRLRRVPYGAIAVSSTGDVWYAAQGSVDPKLRPWTNELAWFQPQTAAGVRHRFLVF